MPFSRSGEQDRDLCLHEIIQAWAARTPDATAVSSDAGMLTYYELNERANRLARLLQYQGVALGSLVGISMKRSLEMIVGLLAILKAGGAFVPLDPGLPRERLLFLASDARLRVILTRGRRLEVGETLVIDLADENYSNWEDSDFESGLPH
jgi:non-ribosomal peptide synthetase component F